MDEVKNDDEKSPLSAFVHENPLPSLISRSDEQFVKFNPSALKINIGTKSMDRIQRKSLFSMIKECLGVSSLQIVIKGYSKDSSTKVNDYRKLVELSDNIAIETDYDDEESDEDESESKIPRISQHTTKLFRRTLNSANFCNLVALKACKPLYSHLKKTAYSKNIRIDLTPRGYSISGNNEEEMDGFENKLREYERNTVFVELYKGKPIDTIKALSSVLSNVRELLMKEYQLENLYIISNHKYNQAYNEIMGNRNKSTLPDEDERPETSLRFVLCKEGIQERKDIFSKVNLTLSSCIHLFKKPIEFPGRKFIRREEIECVTKLVKKAKFMLDIKDYQDIFNKEHPKIVLFAYYYQDKRKDVDFGPDKLAESTENVIQMKCRKLEEKIDKIIPIKSDPTTALLTTNGTDIQDSGQHSQESESSSIEASTKKEGFYFRLNLGNPLSLVFSLLQIKEVTEAVEIFAREKKVSLTKLPGGYDLHAANYENLEEVLHFIQEYYKSFPTIKLKSLHPERKINKEHILKTLQPLKYSFNLQNILLITTKTRVKTYMESADTTTLQRIHFSANEEYSLTVILVQSDSSKRKSDQLMTRLFDTLYQQDLMTLSVEVPNLRSA